MESLLHSHMVISLDDIFVTGPTQGEHLAALEKVLSRLEKDGFRVQKSKCILMSPEEIYVFGAKTQC